MAKCRNVRAKSLVNEMRAVFDHHEDMDCTGLVTGGLGKLGCVRDWYFDKSMVRALVWTPCKDIIEDFRALFLDFYLHLSKEPHVDLEEQLEEEAKRDQDPQVRDARDKLSSSRWVLDMINGHLALQWNVDDDGSLHATVLHPDSVGSKNLLKRKARDSQEDEVENFNQRRKGRLPPLTSANSSGDSLWSQRGPHIRNGTCTTAESSSHGGPGASGSSMPSRGSRFRTSVL
jgi:hypothetical protein